MLNTLHNALEMRLEKGHSYAGKSGSTPRFDEVDTTVNWCIIPNMKAKLEHHSKVTDEYGNVMEIKVWKVPMTEHTPFGYKYSFVYVSGNERVVGYDNERGKGDHRHVGSEEFEYHFTDIATLLRDFQADVMAFKRRVYES